MLLEGSCRCGAVKFRVESHHPYPFMRCYCSICRKAGGGGGYSVNLGAEAKTLRVDGEEHVRVFRAVIDRDGEKVHSDHQRHFCGKCGCHLWAYHPKWPDHLHPVAGAIDTPLPVPPSYVHIMLGSKAPWVEVTGTDADQKFDEYPDMSLAEWHERHGLAMG
jgi:hypothetical protein